MRGAPALGRHVQTLVFCTCVYGNSVCVSNIHEHLYIYMHVHERIFCAADHAALEVQEALSRKCDMGQSVHVNMHYTLQGQRPLRRVCRHMYMYELLTLGAHAQRGLW